MKRIVRTALLFLLLGAILNVAVAWGCAVFLCPWGSHASSMSGWHAPREPMIQNGRTFDIIIIRNEVFGTTRLHTTIQQSNRFGRIPKAERISPYWSDYPRALDERRATLMNIHANGWPLRSFLYRWTTEGVPRPDGSLDARIKFVRGIPLTDYPQSGLGPQVLFRALPYEPIWPGFAFNTGFYATILWLTFVFPFALRRRRRIKHGLCPKCGYDLRGSAGGTCPECGKAVGAIADSR